MKTLTTIVYHITLVLKVEASAYDEKRLNLLIGVGDWVAVAAFLGR